MTPTFEKSQLSLANLEREDQSNLVLAFARVLYINGDSTRQMLEATDRMSKCLELRTIIFPRWGDLVLQTEDTEGKFISAIEAVPSGVDMDRVASTLQAVEEFCMGKLTGADATNVIKRIADAPPLPTWLFTLAAAVGAVALAVIFGVRHPSAAILIFASGAIGAILRRMLAHYSTNLFLQPFGAALVAGIIGALAVRYQLSSSLRLVAVCPCMVLVPGPHFLNGMLDLVRGRMNLGAARLIYAVLVVIAISTGLLLALALFRVYLPIEPVARAVPLWHDVIAAGLAVACYSVFFSMPLNMLPWPVTVGMAAHALRWVVLTALGASAATGAFVACFIVGAVLAPVSRRWRLPFSAIAFASVVSMMPGVLMFRMASGLVQLASSSQSALGLMVATLADGAASILIVLAMSFGLITPMLITDYVAGK
jgi:uncharacterized membrane protein YjjP (DUF1212 family)